MRGSAATLHFKALVSVGQTFPQNSIAAGPTRWGDSLCGKRESGALAVMVTPIVEFRGDDFVVGLWKFKTTFQVSSPPHWDGERWTMVVDGRLLARAGDPPDPTDAAEI